MDPGARLVITVSCTAAALVLSFLAGLCTDRSKAPDEFTEKVGGDNILA